MKAYTNKIDRIDTRKNLYSQISDKARKTSVRQNIKNKLKMINIVINSNCNSEINSNNDYEDYYVHMTG